MNVSGALPLQPGDALVILHLKRFTAPAYRSVTSPSGTAASSRLKIPCAVPHPPNASPQLVMPSSFIWVQVPPPSLVCQISRSILFPSTYQRYISLRPGTTANSPRYKRQLDVDGVAGQETGLRPPGWLFRRFQVAPSL